jgi:hypothetical protein
VRQIFGLSNAFAYKYEKLFLVYLKYLKRIEFSDNMAPVPGKETAQRKIIDILSLSDKYLDEIFPVHLE